MGGPAPRYRQNPVAELVQRKVDVLVNVSGSPFALSKRETRPAMFAEIAKRHGVPLNLCGEMSGRPLEAMTLVGLGFRSISMAPASVGPIKAMVLSLDAGELAKRLDELLDSKATSLREDLRRFAVEHGVQV